MTDLDGSISEHAQIELRDPVLVAAFKGWNDAGDAASFAASHLGRMWSAERCASIDPEEFYDFQAVRPEVRLEDGLTRRITWPQNEFSAAKIPAAERDVLLLIGTEPSLRWRSFCDLVVHVAQRYDVKLALTFGALLADVPHSRPVPITGTAADAQLIERLGLQRSGYEGPTGIVGVLHDAFARAQIDSASLWAAAPHYLSVNPNPKAALALASKATELIGIKADVEELERASVVYEQRVDEMVAEDEDVQAYVKLLEERADRRDEEQIDPEKLPSGDSLAAELEHFLRNRPDSGEI